MNRKLIINNTEMDIGDISIPINFQCSDVASLDNIVCNYSFTIKLPMTEVNLAAINYSQEVSNEDTFPYYYHDCRYYIDGFPIFEKGQVRILRITDSIEISILFGNYELLGLIDKVKLQDLSISEYLMWDYAIANGTNSGFGISQNGDTFFNGKLHVERLVPFVYAKYLFDLIISSYTMPADIESHMGSSVLPLATLKSALAYLNDVVVDIRHSTNINISGAGTWIHTFDSFSEYSDVYNLTFLNTGGLRIFIPPVSGYYIFSFDYYLDTLPFGMAGTVDLIDYYTTSRIDGIAFSTVGNNRTKTIKLNKGQAFYLSLTTNMGGFNFTSNKVTFQLDTDSNGNNFSTSGDCLIETAFKLKYPIKPNLPDITQKDFVKSIMQLYGLMLQIVDGSAQFFTFNDVMDNRTNARDWSDFLVQTNRHETYIDFSSDIGESNFLKYKEDKSVATNYGNYDIPAINQFAKYRDILTNKLFAATESVMEKDSLGNPVRMCKFDLYELSNNSYNLKSITQRICIPQNLDLNYTIDSVYGESTGGAGGDITVNVYTFENSGAGLMYEELANSYWEAYMSIINKYKQMKLKFILPVSEINKFRFDYPIYLSQYGRYFFVKRINNWEVNKVVEIDLIVL